MLLHFLRKPRYQGVRDALLYGQNFAKEQGSHGGKGYLCETLTGWGEAGGKGTTPLENERRKNHQQGLGRRREKWGHKTPRWFAISRKALRGKGSEYGKHLSPSRPEVPLANPIRWGGWGGGGGQVARSVP